RNLKAGGTPKAAGTPKEGNNIRPPTVKKMAGTYDPNYQTLAGLNNADVFKAKVDSIFVLYMIVK
ncbi:hypothetical protein TELCIR_24621, partial [Teladorsagia circumcincta]